MSRFRFYHALQITSWLPLTLPFFELWLPIKESVRHLNNAFFFQISRNIFCLRRILSQSQEMEENLSFLLSNYIAFSKIRISNWPLPVASTRGHLHDDAIWLQVLQTQPRSQGLSSLSSLVVGTETLVAAGHVTIYLAKTAGWVGTQVHLVERTLKYPTLPADFSTTQILGGHVTSRKQGLCSND